MSSAESSRLPVRTAFLVSGEGSTAEAATHAVQEGRLTGIEPVLFLSSDPNAGALQKAERLNVPTAVVNSRDYPGRGTDPGMKRRFGIAINNELAAAGAELVVQAGWMPLTPSDVIQRYRNRIINQHPAPLDPGKVDSRMHGTDGVDFGGRGMHGEQAHAAVLAYAMTTGSLNHTEATTHYVEERFDTGKLVSVAPMALDLPSEQIDLDELRTNPHVQADLKERAEALASQLLPVEHQNLIDTLALAGADFGSFARGRGTLYTRRDLLIPVDKRAHLAAVKDVVVSLYKKK